MFLFSKVATILFLTYIFKATKNFIVKVEIMSENEMLVD